MKTESNGPQASGGGILSRLDPRVAQLIRPLAYALGITVVVFGVYEVADVEQLARRSRPADVLRACEVITTTRRRLTQNAALPLALEGMTVQLGAPA